MAHNEGYKYGHGQFISYSSKLSPWEQQEEGGGREERRREREEMKGEREEKGGKGKNKREEERGGREEKGRGKGRSVEQCADPDGKEPGTALQEVSFLLL